MRLTIWTHVRNLKKRALTFKRSSKLSNSKDVVKESRVKDSKERKSESSNKEENDNDTVTKKTTKTQSNGCTNAVSVVRSVVWCIILALTGLLV